MFKKSLIGSVVIVSGFIIREIRAGEEIHWGDSFLFWAVALVFGIFIEWTFIPYHWEKHKNKHKEKKDLS